MTPELALQILSNATAQLQATRQVHEQIVEALRVVKELMVSASSLVKDLPAGKP